MARNWKKGRTKLHNDKHQLYVDGDDVGNVVKDYRWYMGGKGAPNASVNAKTSRCP